MRSVVACYSLDGKLVKVYESAKKAAKSRKLFPRTIDRCTRGDILTVKGLYWKRFKIDEIPKTIEVTKKVPTSLSIKPVAKIDENGEIIEAYPSIRNASIKNNIDAHSLRDVLNKKYPYIGKAKFRYLLDNEIDKYNFKKGRKIDNNIKPIIQLSTDDKYIKTYPSIVAALKALNKPLKSQAISKCLKGEYLTAYGYKWKYKDLKNNVVIKTKKIYIYALDENSKVIHKYNSTKEASKSLCVSVSSINNAIRLKTKLKGYYWKRK